MVYLILSFGSFLLAVIFHCVWCRFKKSSELQVLPFFLLAALNLAVYVFVVRIFLKPLFNGTQSLWNMPLEITSITFFILLVPFYTIFYYSVNIDSPSRTILFSLEQNKGLSLEQLREHVTNNKFIMSRLKDLVESRSVFFDGKKYRLSAHMIIIGRLLNLCQIFTGRTIGG